MPTQEPAGIDAIQARLGALERMVPGLAPGRPRHRRGLRISDWFLPTGIAWRLALAPGAGLGPLLAFGPGRAAMALATRRRHGWRLGADALAIGGNYRLFYLGAGLTLKVHFPEPGGGDPVMREIEARHRARSTATIRLPEIVEAGQALGASYFAEPLIAGAERIDPARCGEELAEAMFGFYTANGMTVRPLAKAVETRDWCEDVGAALAAAGTAPAAAEAAVAGFGNILGEAAEENALWGLCHGDLALGNMLRAGGRIYLLDWEDAHDGPIYGDLAKLAVSVPGFQACFDARARVLSGTDAAIVAQKCLADAALLRKLWREDAAGADRPAKRRRFKAAAQRLIDRCAEYAPPAPGRYLPAG